MEALPSRTARSQGGTSADRRAHDVRSRCAALGQQQGGLVCPGSWVALPSDERTRVFKNLTREKRGKVSLLLPRHPMGTNPLTPSL